jgi:hypothetical protein
MKSIVKRAAWRGTRSDAARQRHDVDVNDYLAPGHPSSSIDGKSSSVRQLECAILAGFPGNAYGEAFADSFDILDRKIIILITFLLNFRSFVDNRIDFYAKTL